MKSYSEELASEILINDYVATTRRSSLEQGDFERTHFTDVGTEKRIDEWTKWCVQQGV